MFFHKKSILWYNIGKDQKVQIKKSVLSIGYNISD